MLGQLGQLDGMTLPCSQGLHKQELVACARQWHVVKGVVATLVQEKQDSQVWFKQIPVENICIYVAIV